MSLSLLSEPLAEGGLDPALLPALLPVLLLVALPALLPVLECLDDFDDLGFSLEETRGSEDEGS